jgi:hypothetical protein
MGSKHRAVRGAVPLASHEVGSEVEVRLISVVPSSQQPDIVDAVVAAAGERDDVMELESIACRAATTLVVTEGALPAVAGPDRATDGIRDMTGGGCRVGLDDFLARSSYARECSPLEIVQEKGHRAIDDRRQVSGRRASTSARWATSSDSMRRLRRSNSTSRARSASSDRSPRTIEGEFMLPHTTRCSRPRHRVQARRTRSSTTFSLPDTARWLSSPSGASRARSRGWVEPRQVPPCEFVN